MLQWSWRKRAVMIDAVEKNSAPFDDSFGK
jgi:hypothetical protein